MRAYVAVTDNDWYEFLRGRPDLDEVNFWQPGGKRVFDLLEVGQPLLFKLHSPLNFIVGGGFFTHASLVDATTAWEAFGPKNGAATFEEMCERIERYRSGEKDPHREYTIGCIMLRDPFFFERVAWISAPSDFRLQTVQGKGYDLQTGIGKQLWNDVSARLGSMAPRIFTGPMYGPPALRKQRLGQGTFQLLIADTYDRRCAVTGERAFPALQAAHIQPVSKGGIHEVGNGLLLRSDIHALFDRGYVTVTTDYRFKTSEALKTDFDNGEDYRRFENALVRLPARSELHPSKALLGWHADTLFRR